MSDAQVRDVWELAPDVTLHPRAAAGVERDAVVMIEPLDRRNRATLGFEKNTFGVEKYRYLFFLPPLGQVHEHNDADQRGQ